MKIIIDPDLCTGCEDRIEACPSLFRLGANWLAELVHEVVPKELEAEVVKTAGICQFEAIGIQE